MMWYIIDTVGEYCRACVGGSRKIVKTTSKTVVLPVNVKVDTVDSMIVNGKWVHVDEYIESVTLCYDVYGIHKDSWNPDIEPDIRLQKIQSKCVTFQVDGKHFSRTIPVKIEVPTDTTALDVGMKPFKSVLVVFKLHFKGKFGMIAKAPTLPEYILETSNRFGGEVFPLIVEVRYFPTTGGKAKTVLKTEVKQNTGIKTVPAPQPKPSVVMKPVTPTSKPLSMPAPKSVVSTRVHAMVEQSQPEQKKTFPSWIIPVGVLAGLYIISRRR